MNISSQDAIEVKDKDFFQTYTEKVRTKREDHVKKTLEWANQGGFFRAASNMEGGDHSPHEKEHQHDLDVDMEDVS